MARTNLRAVVDQGGQAIQGGVELRRFDRAARTAAEPPTAGRPSSPPRRQSPSSAEIRAAGEQHRILRCRARGRTREPPPSSGYLRSVEERPGSGPEPVHVWVKPVDGDQRSAAHTLLLGLAATLGGGEPVLRHDETGRPHVDPLWVSVSHGHDLVAVAVGAVGPVGVDLENRRSFEVAGLAERWFDPAELAWMAAQPDEVEAFLRLWTAKEAVGKALGRGLRGSGLRRLMPLPPAPLAPAGPLPPPDLHPQEPLDPPPPDARPLTGGPLTGGPLIGGPLTGDLVPSEPTLALLHLPLRANAVLAVAVPAVTPSVEVCEHHGAALRSTVTSRTSFPVVVRGN